MNQTPDEVTQELDLVRQSHVVKKSLSSLKEDVRSLAFERGPGFDTALDYFKQFSVTNLPSEKHVSDFFATFRTPKHKKIAMMIVLNYSDKQISEKLGLTHLEINKYRRMKSTRVFGALYECVHLDTEDEKIAFIKQMENCTFDSAKTTEAKTVAKMVRSPGKQLKELAKNFKGSGDEKRKILRELIAYGMQARTIEPAQVDMVTGEVTAEAVIALCDHNAAFRALQELNRMDHEYHEDDAQVSSIEAQEERIKRLKKEAKEFREKQRKSLNDSIKEQQKMEKAKMKLVKK